MSRRTIAIIVVAAILFHAGLFFWMSRVQALPKAHKIPRPNFGSTEQTYQDAETGEKITYREIRVSTTLADPALLKKLDAERAGTPPPAQP